MSRYIDADALKEYIGNARAEFDFFDDDERARYEAHSKGIYLLDLYVDDAPSIDIVFCKECRHSFINENHPQKPRICGLTKKCGTTKDDWFCADGERREP